MNTMQVIVIDPDVAGRLAIRETGRPSPSQSETLVRVSAISLNLGEVRATTTAQAGWRPGWDLAGIVEQAATDGSGPRIGARVVGMVNSGAWAEWVAVPTAVLAEIPDTVTFAQAATLPVAGLTALYALEKGGSLLNRRVLITGASGGVGHFACQLARQAGSYVTGLVRRAEYATYIKELGVHEVIIGEDGAQARSSGPYDLVIDALGGKSLDTALTLLAPDGLCVNIGGAENPEVTLQIRHHSTLTGGFHLYGLYLAGEIQRRSGAAKELRQLTQMVAEGRLHPRINVEDSWTEIAEVAQRLLKRQISGKAVLHVSPDSSSVR